MNRRTFLTGSGATLSIAIAGCASSDSANNDDQGSSAGGPETQYMESSDDDSSESGGSGDDSGADDADDQPISPAEGVLEVSDFNVEGGADEEYIEFTNTASEPVDLAGAYVRDGKGGQVDNGYSRFQFSENTVLQPGESIRLWTGNGMNSMYDVYWKYSAEMWDDESDTIIVGYNNERILEHSY